MNLIEDISINYKIIIIIKIKIIDIGLFLSNILIKNWFRDWINFALVTSIILKYKFYSKREFLIFIFRTVDHKLFDI